MAAGFRYLAVSLPATPFLKLFKFADDALTEVDIDVSSVAVSTRAVAFSPDGRYLIIAPSTTTANRFRAWKRDDNGVFVPLPTENLIGFSQSMNVQDMRYHPSSKHLYMVSNGGLYQIEVDTVNDTFTLNAPIVAGAMTSLAISSTGKFIISGRAALPFLHIYSYSNGALTSINPPAGASAVSDLAISPDETKFVTVGGTSPSLRLGTITGTTVAYSANQPEQPSTAPVDVRWSASGRHVITGRSTTPFLEVYRLIGESLVKAGAADIAGSTNEIAPGAGELADRIAVGFASSNVTSGRLGIYKLDREDDTLTRIPTISLDLAAAVQWVVWSPLMEADSAGGGLYNDTIHRLNVGLDTDNLKLLLLTTADTFDPAHASLADAVGADEALGAGWPAGGVTLHGVSFVKAAGKDGGFTFTFPPTALNDPGELTFKAAIIYEDTHPTKAPLFHLPFKDTKTAVQYDQIGFELFSGNLLLYTPG